MSFIKQKQTSKAFVKSGQRFGNLTEMIWDEGAMTWDLDVMIWDRNLPTWTATKQKQSSTTFIKVEQM